MTDTQSPQQPRRSRRWLGDLRLALMLLTRLPLPAGRTTAAPQDGDVARASWIFPMVGLLVGLAGGGVFMAASGLGLGISSAALLAMATQVLLTGALHEDGLADMADGFGGGRDRARKLEIMRDSRIGTYGVVALVLVLGLRFSALQELASNLLSISDEIDENVGSQNSAIIIALIAAGALSRAAMVAVWYLLPPARSDGLAAGSGTVPFGAALTAALLAMAIAYLMLPGFAFLVACATVAALTLTVAGLAYWQIRGHTGDVLGATQQVTEIGALLAIAVATLAA